jgi:hypothetical protein
MRTLTPTKRTIPASSRRVALRGHGAAERGRSSVLAFRERRRERDLRWFTRDRPAVRVAGPAGVEERVSGRAEPRGEWLACDEWMRRAPVASRGDVGVVWVDMSGTCLLVIDEQERELPAWEFVDCLAGTKHAFIGTR